MIRKFFLENLGLKISAVVIAVILWLFVISKGQTEISLNVPIEYANIPSGIEIAKRGVKSAEVTIRTHESLAKNIKQDNVKVIMDVGRAKIGEGLYPLRKDDVTLPLGATIARIDPPAVKIVFEETLSKKVPIKAVVVGAPENSYYVKSVEVTPPESVIEGAKSEVRRVSLLKTEVIDVTGMTEDFIQEVGLDVSDGKIRMSSAKTTVHIRIAKRGK